MSKHKSMPNTSAVALTEAGKQSIRSDSAFPEGVDPKVLDGAFWMSPYKDEWAIFCGELTVIVIKADMFVSLDTFTAVERVKIAMNNPQPKTEHDFRVNNNHEDDWRMWDIRVSEHPSFVPPWDGIVDSPLVWFALTDEQRVALANTTAKGSERLQYVSIACEAMYAVMQEETVIEPVTDVRPMQARRMPPITAKCQQSEMFREWMSRKRVFRTNS